MNENLLSYATPVATRRRERIALCLGMAACLAGVGGMWVGLSPVLGLLDSPVGSEVSFFSLDAALILGKLAGFFVALPLGVVGLILGWRWRAPRWVGFLGILLALAAIFLAEGLCGWIVSNRKLIPFND
jgi:hypothetical protein